MAALCLSKAHDAIVMIKSPVFLPLSCHEQVRYSPHPHTRQQHNYAFTLPYICQCKEAKQIKIHDRSREMLSHFVNKKNGQNTEHIEQSNFSGCNEGLGEVWRTIEIHY